MAGTKLNPADELENIKRLLPHQRADALKASVGLSAKLSKQPSLQKEELEILVIAATLLHENGKDADALKHLRRFHDEVLKNPGIVDKHPALAWGELLYTTVSMHTNFSAALIADMDTARKNSGNRGKISGKGVTRATPGGSGGGCSVIAAFICCIAVIFGGGGSAYSFGI